MKSKLAAATAALVVGLAAGGSIAQPSTTTRLPMKDSPIEPAGGAQGRTPTSINTPDKGSGTKAMPVPGSTAMKKQEKVVNSRSEQVQGSTSSSAKATMQLPGRKPGKKMDHMGAMSNNKGEPAVVLTTPAPGPANTTPSAK